jgi:hypothetical protein
MCRKHPEVGRRPNPLRSGETSKRCCGQVYGDPKDRCENAPVVNGAAGTPLIFTRQRSSCEGASSGRTVHAHLLREFYGQLGARSDHSVSLALLLWDRGDVCHVNRCQTAGLSPLFQLSFRMGISTRRAGRFCRTTITRCRDCHRNGSGHRSRNRALGSSNTSTSAIALQQQYDIAYAQWMAAAERGCRRSLSHTHHTLSLPGLSILRPLVRSARGFWFSR